MDTETRSDPDLSLVRVAFLCATMKGASELASAEEDTNNKATKTEIRPFNIVFSMVTLISGFPNSEFLVSIRKNFGVYWIGSQTIVGRRDLRL